MPTVDLERARLILRAANQHFESASPLADTGDAEDAADASEFLVKGIFMLGEASVHAGGTRMTPAMHLRLATLYKKAEDVLQRLSGR